MIYDVETGEMNTMGMNTRNITNNPINDFWQCLQDAQYLADQLSDTRQNKRVYRAFTSLAGDKTIGFMAYVIWKGRGRWISSLSND